MKIKKLVTFAIVIAILATSTMAADPFNLKENVCVLAYDPNVDYLAMMRECASAGDEHSLAMGGIYELQRNLKLTTLRRDDEQTYYFHPGKSGEEILFEMHLDDMRKEYETATDIYIFLHNCGYSDVVAAGIIGNFMAETGGQTLDIQWDIYDRYHDYYGIAMWALCFNREVDGRGLIGQLYWLSETIKPNMTQFGGKGMYDTFVKSATPPEAARIFCTYYEKGAGVYQRQKNANVAYNWIVGE